MHELWYMRAPLGNSNVNSISIRGTVRFSVQMSSRPQQCPIDSISHIPEIFPVSVNCDIVKAPLLRCSGSMNFQHKLVCALPHPRLYTAVPLFSARFTIKPASGDARPDILRRAISSHQPTLLTCSVDRNRRVAGSAAAHVRSLRLAPPAAATSAATTAATSFSENDDETHCLATHALVSVLLQITGLQRAAVWATALLPGL